MALSFTVKEFGETAVEARRRNVCRLSDTEGEWFLRVDLPTWENEGGLPDAPADEELTYMAWTFLDRGEAFLIISHYIPYHSTKDIMLPDNPIPFYACKHYPIHHSVYLKKGYAYSPN